MFMRIIIKLSVILIVSSSIVINMTSCKKKEKEEINEPIPTANLAIDSLVATKTDILAYEEIDITAYTKGSNLNYLWTANHGSMIGVDSVTVKYWACYSCLGTNTVKCEVSNEYGTVSDTIQIVVTVN